ncbi:hypothetical protein EIP91_004437 [Steccherinum ochraceum]|uniref:F-box domain-containing protein n=1 Tax=Steccherinum ochraceum TaxID=92696 RepID=A0A4R0RBY8_9APHY|nr:hypothetical protein EIP91_004437 [Steccherinum ochraceum]
MNTSSNTADKSAVIVPIDIVYNITYYLANDRVTLKSCSLVSQEWHAVARKHLLSSILVHNAREEHNLSGFHRFVLEDPSSCHFITTLRIAHKGSHWNTIHGIYQILKQLPRLRALAIEHLHVLDTAECAHRDVMLPISLELLSLTDCSAATSGPQVDWHPFFDLINMFPTVKTLFLLTYPTTKVGCAMHYESPEIRLEDVDRAFLECLNQRVDLSEVASLVLLPRAHLRHFQPTLSGLHSLKSILISADASDIHFLGLRSLTSLEVIEFEVYVFNLMLVQSVAPGFTAKLRLVNHVLETLPPSSSVSSIRIYLRTAYINRGDFEQFPGQINAVEWGALPSTVASLRNLSMLAIHLDPSLPPIDATDRENMDPALGEGLGASAQRIRSKFDGMKVTVLSHGRAI